MTPERWAQVKEIFGTALDTPQAERSRFLDSACGGDAELRAEVEGLLAGSEEPSWQSPAAQLGTAAAELAPGDTIAHYRIEARLGEGGMGVVYKARDTRLRRTVALKFVKVEFGSWVQREARAVAALNHPHICAIYDVGPDYLVMEYVDGAPPKGPMPVPQALDYATQILEALEAAHRAGIVHRDLKPANILIGKQGVKLLDFGLARRIRSPQVDESATTATGPVTEAGAMAGTLRYMAPEQLEGREPDARTDIFAFGCVLYEMLTGRPAFEGKTPASLVAAILRADPAPLSAIQPSVPAALSRVLDGCLAKNHDERWQSATDVRRALLLAGESQNLATQPARRRWIVPAVAVVAVAIVVLFGWLLARPIQQNVAPLRFVIPSPEGSVNPGALSPQILAPLAVSPDGRAVAMVETDATGRSYVWIRRFDSVSPVRLDSTVGATFAFWSPDSRQIGFNADRAMKRVSVNGGAAQIFAEPGGQGSWSRDGKVLFTVLGKIYVVPVAGGTPSLVAEPDPKDDEMGYEWPEFLPDGNHFLYLSRRNNEDGNAIYLRELGSARKSRLVTSKVRGVFAAPGYVLFAQGFARRPNLLAQRLDLANWRLDGEALTVAEDLPGQMNGPLTLIGFSVSTNGVLAYRSRPTRHLAWYDRDGTRTSASSEAGFTQVVLSPDGRNASQILENRLCVRDLLHGALNCFNLGPATLASVALGTWSPDSKRIAITTQAAGQWELREFNIESGSSRVLYSDKRIISTPIWSGDGRFITFMSFVPRGTEPPNGVDVYLLPLSGEPKPRLLFHTPGASDHFNVSRDGRWITYGSNELGRFEIYVNDMNSPTTRIQVSTSGGVQPNWRADGKELFYLRPDGKMFAADFTPGSPPRAGKPHPLFQTNLRPAFSGRLYSPSPDGRFLVLESDEPETADLNIQVHWDSALRR